MITQYGLCEVSRSIIHDFKAAHYGSPDIIKC